MVRGILARHQALPERLNRKAITSRRSPETRNDFPSPAGRVAQYLVATSFAIGAHQPAEPAFRSVNLQAPQTRRAYRAKDQTTRHAQQQRLDVQRNTREDPVSVHQFVADHVERTQALRRDETLEHARGGSPPRECGHMFPGEVPREGIAFLRSAGGANIHVK